MLCIYLCIYYYTTEAPKGANVVLTHTHFYKYTPFLPPPAMHPLVYYITTPDIPFTPLPLFDCNLGICMLSIYLSMYLDRKNCE